MSFEKYHSTLKWQSVLLIVLRFLIGWHLLYEGVYKFLDANWSASFFLAESTWIFSGIAEWIISDPVVLKTVDILNKWGLSTIGLGLFTKASGIAGFILLGIYYLFNPPFITTGSTIPLEGNYLIVNKTLIEAVMLLLIAVSPSTRLLGLDNILNRKK